MSEKAPTQRNGFVPGIIAAAALVVGPALIGTGGYTVVLFLVAILALIVGWFAWTARQWWWTLIMVAIAVVWNPVMPWPFEGPLWLAAHPVAAVLFIVAGIAIRTPAAAQR